MDSIKINNDITLEFNTETALGEPQGWLYLSNGRSLEVTYESAGIPNEKDYFFSVRLHCSEEEFDNDWFHATCGVVEEAIACSLVELTELLGRILDNFAIQGLKVV